MSSKKNERTKKKAYFTIGEMANLFHMNIRTLRYYDEIGLLKPEFTDPKTHYRYYSTNQFERLNTIKYLRMLDMPIEKISLFFEDKDVFTLLDILTVQHETVVKKQAELSRIERKITKRIEQIHTALNANFGEVILKNFPERAIVLLKKRFTYQEDLEPLIRDLSKKHHLDDAIFLGKVGVSISQADLHDGMLSHFSAIFILLEAEDDLIEPDTFLAAGTYATVQYQGTHEAAQPHYTKLLNYLDSKGYSIIGNSVEITMIDAGITNHPQNFVTELQIPILKSKRKNVEF